MSSSLPEKSVSHLLSTYDVAPGTLTLTLNSSQSNAKSPVGANTLNSLVPVPEKKRKRIEIIEQKFFFPMEIQTELTMTDISYLFQQYQGLVQDREKMLLQISNLKLDYDYFRGNDKKTLFYTGLPTWKLLNHLFKWVEPFLPEHGNAKLSPFQMFVLTLMKLRLNLLFTDLAYRFEIQVSTASNYFHRCIYILYKKFFGSKLIFWPDDQYLIINTPSYFRSHLKDKITVVVDCFELFIERSSVLRALAQAWSTYKHHVTIKFLIGISMSGAIIFISPAFGGRASDKEITLKSGFLNFLKKNNLVLADKGFLVEEEIKKTGASLRMPCFVKNVKQLAPTDVEHTRETANLRIHVERLISVLRQKFNICSDLAPMSAISKKNDYYNNDLYDKIVYICCCLVNLCPPTIVNNFEM
ncbi:uncharacterized protein LOC119072593 [Bradysia coprophila]|uniref:uncharacterized protein LOC119072593 n=1 Tax=Bradysia coprophila TaxID=38358 RepID=UPI00187DC9CB|nr:uncharacterized protein LOC119072593 [Bradysia coprophila]